MELHYVKYGIAADQKYLLEYIKSYSNLIINARTIAHTPKALFLFLHKIHKKVNFVLDPETHAFQHDHTTLESSSKSNKGRNIIKKSIKALLNAYGKPIEKIVNDGSIVLPEDFNSNSIRGFCKRVIDFQTETLQKQKNENDVSEYYDFLVKKKKISPNHIKPEFIIAPYFYLDGYNYDEWLKMNIRCIEVSNSLLNNSSNLLAGELVISKNTLNSKVKIDNITAKYNLSNANRIYLWIDSFSEHEVDEEDLRNYIKLLKLLKKPIVNLHGGYFTLLLKKLKISNNIIGNTHALGYGEDRAVVPIGGGVPTAKFYIPSLHKRLIYRNALESIKALGGAKDRESYFRNICDCETCRDIIKNKPKDDFEKYGVVKIGKDGREYPTSETIELCLRHYMNCKIKEYTENINMNQVRQQLTNTYTKLQRTLPENEISHCKTWVNILASQS